ncbi:hypothetical protein SAMN03080618_03320 [Aquamicrobium aerolatum DSM 21857]|uniref:Uncharacterized protein n=1 Tax=Aquamicrobium aerolatum DSM 21857 TaxID=1121003 RepID=A0A1I3SF46_9HYPH|nr:hypothetical protein SAMN03080618_03320 [Aquamicrobium aerolatum DSM 21857]
MLVAHFGAVAAAFALSPSRWHYELLAQPRLFPAVSPKLRPEWLSVKVVEDLFELPVITADADGLWGVWLRMAGAEPLVPMRGPNMPNTHIMMEAATFG